MSGTGKPKQAIVTLTLPRIEALLRGKHPQDELEKLVAALLYNLGSADSYEVKEYLTRMCRRAAALVQHNVKVPPSLIARFLNEGVKLLGYVADLGRPNLAVDRIDDMLGNGITRIFGALDAIFGAAYRYRLYTIHPSDHVYRGLVSISMPDDYEVEFDVRSSDRFGKTKEIPFTEPPYQLVPKTNCHVLQASELDRIPIENRGWYTDRLRLGDAEHGVPRTYTWELTRNGPAEELCLRADADNQAEYAIAFSLDAGDETKPYGERVLGDAEIHLLDELLLSPFGKAFAEYFFQLRSGLEAQTLGGSAEFVPPEALVELWRDAQHRQVGWGERLNPWVFAATDPVADGISQAVLELEDSDDFVQIIGPSGVGKQRLAEALHRNGKRRAGALIIQATASVVESGVGHQLLRGSEEGTFSGVGSVESIFETADGGTVVLDEFYRVPQAEREKHLLTIVGNLGSKPRQGWYRSGTKEEICPDVRILLTGNPAAGEESMGDMQRRFPRTIRVPSWYELNTASRSAIVRWFVIRQLKERGMSSAEISGELLGFLISGGHRISELPAGNMSFIDNWLAASSTVVDDRLQYSLARLKFETHPDARGKAAAILKNGSETFSERLTIGAESRFHEKLDGIAALAYVIASSHRSESECGGCVDVGAARAVLESIQDRSGAFTAYYLLLAASNMLVTYDKNANADDPYLTAPDPVKRHLGALRSFFSDWFEERTTYQPTQLRSSNRSQYPGWMPFKNHIYENAAEISQITFAIQCALPAFPDFPYWSGWFSSTKERANGKTTARRKQRAQKQSLPLEP